MISEQNANEYVEPSGPDLAIVIDTNMLLRHSRLGDTAWLRLATYAKKWSIRIVIPPVVRQEFKYHLKQQYDDLQNSLRQHKRNFRDLPSAFLGPLQNVLESIDESSLNAESDVSDESIDAYLRELIPCELELVGWSDISIPDVLEKLLRQRKPFKKHTNDCKEKGFRDELVWLTVIDEAKARDFKVVLLSNNIADFAADGSKQKALGETSAVKQVELHPDLIADLNARSIDDKRVVLFTDLTSLEDRLIVPLLADVVQQWQLEFTVHPDQIGYQLHNDYRYEMCEAFEKEIPNLFDVPYGADMIDWDVDEPTRTVIFQMASVDETTLLIKAGLSSSARYFFETDLDEEDPEETDFGDHDDVELKKEIATVRNEDDIFIEVSLLYDIPSQTWTQFSVDRICRLIRGDLSVMPVEDTTDVEVSFAASYDFRKNNVGTIVRMSDSDLRRLLNLFFWKPFDKAIDKGVRWSGKEFEVSILERYGLLTEDTRLRVLGPRKFTRHTLSVH
jgi:hypothetical protein